MPGVNPGADAVMVADPSLRPLICGGVEVQVFRAAMKTVGVTVAVVRSLLTSDTVVPAAGAGVGREIWSAAD